MSRDRNDRNKNARRELMVSDCPPEIHAALYHAAHEQQVSVNEAAVRILAAHYNVKHITPANGLRGHDGAAIAPRRNPESDKLSIRGGSKLHRKISVDAARRDGTLRGVVLECLALAFELEPPPIGRRPKKTVDA